MSLKRNAVAALACVAGVFATASVAAAYDPAAHPPQPITEADPVTTEIRILDEQGGVVQTLACHWDFAPEDDDRECLKFKSDPDVAVAAIREAGGASAVDRTSSVGFDAYTRWKQRSDGSWLISGGNAATRKGHSWGFVCDENGDECVEWHTQPKTSKQRAIRAASSKLKQRMKD